MSDPIRDLVNELENKLAPIFRQMEIAQEEVLKAQANFGETGQDGPIWRSWILMRIPHMTDRMPETLYRAHCAELAERAAKGEDTRPATAAEMVYPLSKASLQAPLAPAAVGVYLKLMHQSFPDVISQILDEIGRYVQDYERLHGQQMEEIEGALRTKLRQRWRTL